MTFRAWSGLSASIVLCILFSQPALAQADRLAAGSTATSAALPAKAQDAFDAAYELARKGKPEKALELYEEAAKLAPNSADVWQEYAVCLRQTYHLQRAAQACWRAMEVGGQTAGLWNNMGNIFLSAEAWKAASLAYDKADTLSSNKRLASDNFLKLGYRQWQAGDNDGATKSFAHAIELDPKNGMAVLDMASVKASQGNTQDALKQINEAKPFLEAEENQRGLKYAQYLEGAVRKTTRLPSPIEFAEFQHLPDRFLTQPPKGQSLSLQIDPTVRKSFRLTSGIVMSINVDDSWTVSLDTKTMPALPTIGFAPATGDDFRLLWTPLSAAKRSVDIKGLLEDNSREMLSQSVEKELVIKELKSPSMHGYYFLATDKSLVDKTPGEGQYPYVIISTLNAGNVDCTLTVLSRKKDEQFVKEMTEAISSISCDKPAADTAK